MSPVFGYFAAALIGISLGLIGGGGSILTVPVLVYLFGVGATDATALSLIIVGGTALTGALNYIKRGLVDIRVALAFAIPSVAGVYLMRRFVIPGIPRVILNSGSMMLTKDQLILFVFGFLMLAASISMIRQREIRPAGEPHLARLGVQGFFTGIVTGSVGAGGGFLIVPALVLLARVPMKRAVATSLLIIAINSLLGFIGDLQAGRDIPWPLVSSVLGIAIAGSFLGAALAHRIHGEKLKPAFGYFVLVMGAFVIGGEVLKAYP